MLKQFRNLSHLLKTFPDEQACIDFLYDLNPNCPRCDYPKTWRFRDGKRFKCAGCKRQFTMKTNTIFENSNITLRQWFIIYYLNTKPKKGMSSYAIADEAGITQKTCWYKLQAIRWALGKDQPTQMAGIVEGDETYYGGKKKNKHKNKRTPGNADKTIVGGLYSRSSGKVRIEVIPTREAKDLQPFVTKTLHRNWTFISDDHGGYTGLNDYYNHIILNSSAYEHTRELKEGDLKSSKRKDGDKAHKNNIEGFWPWIDRSVMGVYHNISPKHLPFYLNEFAFRFNNRNLSTNEKLKLAISYRYGQTSYKKIREREQPSKQEPFKFRPRS